MARRTRRTRLSCPKKTRRRLKTKGQTKGHTKGHTKQMKRKRRQKRKDPSYCPYCERSDNEFVGKKDGRNRYHLRGGAGGAAEDAEAAGAAGAAEPDVLLGADEPVVPVRTYHLADDAAVEIGDPRQKLIELAGDPLAQVGEISAHGLEIPDLFTIVPPWMTLLLYSSSGEYITPFHSVLDTKSGWEWRAAKKARNEGVLEKNIKLLTELSAFIEWAPKGARRHVLEGQIAELKLTIRKQSEDIEEQKALYFREYAPGSLIPDHQINFNTVAHKLYHGYAVWWEGGILIHEAQEFLGNNPSMQHHKTKPTLEKVISKTDERYISKEEIIGRGGIFRLSEIFKILSAKRNSDTPLIWSGTFCRSGKGVNIEKIKADCLEYDASVPYEDILSSGQISSSDPGILLRESSLSSNVRMQNFMGMINYVLSRNDKEVLQNASHLNSILNFTSFDNLFLCQILSVYWRLKSEEMEFSGEQDGSLFNEHDPVTFLEERKEAAVRRNEWLGRRLPTAPGEK